MKLPLQRNRLVKNNGTSYNLGNGHARQLFRVNYAKVPLSRFDICLLSSCCESWPVDIAWPGVDSISVVSEGAKSLDRGDFLRRLNFLLSRLLSEPLLIIPSVSVSSFGFG